MKKLLVTSFLSGMSLLMLSQTTSVNIIPIPVSVAVKTGSFQLTDKTVIELASTDADANRAAHFLADALSTPTGATSGWQRIWLRLTCVSSVLHGNNYNRIGYKHK